MSRKSSPSRTDTPPADNGGVSVPWAPDAEDHVLAAALVSNTVIPRVARTIRPEHFYRDSERALYSALVELAAAGIDADPVVLADHLRRNGTLDKAGGIPRVAELAALAPATGNVEHHAKIVRDRADARRDLDTALELRSAVLNGGIATHPDLVEKLRSLVEPRPEDVDEIPVLDLELLLAGDPPEIPWLWEGWLSKGDLAMLAADPGTGKSMLLLAVAVAMRAGGEVLGSNVVKGRAGIIDLENPVTEVHARLSKMGLRFDDADRLAYASNVDIDLTRADSYSRLEKMIATHELDLLVVDSLRAAAPGADENDSGEMAMILTPLRRLTANTGCTVALIHHAKKRQSDAATDAMSMLRGSSAIGGALDQLLFARKKAGEKHAFTLEVGKGRRGGEHESILVRMVDSTWNDGLPKLEMVNEGEIVSTVSGTVETMLDRIVETLRDEGSYLTRAIIALRLGVGKDHRAFGQALKQGYDREILARRIEVGKPHLYAYVGTGLETPTDGQLNISGMSADHSHHDD